MSRKNGYYKVKFYNHVKTKIMYWNGVYFECFKSDPIIHDEIESYDPITPKD